MCPVELYGRSKLVGGGEAPGEDPPRRVCTTTTPTARATSSARSYLLHRCTAARVMPRSRSHSHRSPRRSEAEGQPRRLWSERVMCAGTVGALGRLGMVRGRTHARRAGGACGLPRHKELGPVKSAR